MAKAFPFRKGTRNVSLSQRYFDSMDGREIPFTPGKRYPIIMVEPFGKEPYRYTVVLEDDDGNERRLDASWFRGYVFTLDPMRVTKDRPKRAARPRKDDIDAGSVGPMLDEEPAPAREKKSSLRFSDKDVGRLGNYIKMKRKEAEASQSAFAETLGIPQSYLSAIENGRIRSSSLERAEFMADGLGLEGIEREEFYSMCGQGNEAPPAVPAEKKAVLKGPEEAPHGAVPDVLERPCRRRRPMTIAKYMKKSRKESGRSLAFIAAEVGLSMHYVSLLESGDLKSIPYPEKRERLADVLGLTGERKEHFLRISDPDQEGA